MRTAIGGDDESPRKRFSHFTNREASRICRDLGIPINILDLLEELRETYNLDLERISKAREAGCPIAEEVLEDFEYTKSVAMEGLLVQKSLENLGKIQARNEHHLALLERNKALVDRNRELERYTKSLFIAVTKSQFKTWMPSLGVVALLTSFFIIAQNGRHTTPINPPQTPNSVQPSK
jgi:hypothetical protein